MDNKAFTYFESRFSERMAQEWPEGFSVFSEYDKKDINRYDFLNFGAGKPPFLRGPYESMYLDKPWTIRQYAGFSTAEESNAFYRRNLASGQKACR